MNYDFYNNYQNSRALIGSYPLSIRVQTIKMTSDVTRSLSQWKIKPIPLIRFSRYCKNKNKKQIDGSFIWSVLL